MMIIPKCIASALIYKDKVGWNKANIKSQLGSFMGYTLSLDRKNRSCSSAYLHWRLERTAVNSGLYS